MLQPASSSLPLWPSSSGNVSQHKLFVLEVNLGTALPIKGTNMSVLKSSLPPAQEDPFYREENSVLLRLDGKKRRTQLLSFRDSSRGKMDMWNMKDPPGQEPMRSGNECTDKSVVPKLPIAGMALRSSRTKWQHRLWTVGYSKSPMYLYYLPFFCHY